jgi:hypothetical protein
MRRAALLAVVMCGALAASARALPPTVTPIVTGQLGDNGWYVNDVIVNWSITPPGFLVDFGCEASTAVRTDTVGRKIECQASSGPDKTYASVTIRLDKTAPSVVARADRPPDGGGFYNHPLTVSWPATDPTSGVASCAPASAYAGPDATGVSLSGTCRDVAGNVSAPVAFVLNYDSSPPAVANLTASIGKKTANVAWEVSGASTVVLVRASARAPSRQRVVYQGAGNAFLDRGLTTGRHYTYLVRAIDQAGNVATKSINVTPGSASSDRLLAPRANTQLRRPPLLRWRKVQRASYYNVQLFRSGRKILSAWPTKPHYQLRPSWRYGGQRHRLTAATYRWYLWAGYGKRSARHYGHLLGQRAFKVR